ncbi:MerR family transcriptional regulator [Bacillus cereus group sp. LD113LC]|uniref:MerR family transcriptional regulator n=1 Tax=Bacillus cereus group sp. LD113LC TaxID=3018074 RepID=UPI001F05B2D0|nr:MULTISPECIES: MerR family transcriptional regulator [Bacillus cereus group]MCU5562393.1 MerR family transcriptional regulator [Bacillus pacificus]MDA1625826.1 MerR family transcriptional regulator [Bacillus cereus group sp. TH206-1LC]MDA1753045.1 MerR family transcriptional regulator [Bacillus cereus group sp. LD113LC]MDX5917480.1 MerR family transcriptional regulator [Bacillus cereus group sp. BfR-BA-01026]
MEYLEEIKEFTQKEVSELTELSSDLLRLYEKEFNLDIKRTKGNHRRYTEEDINKFVTIKKMIQDQNLSYKQVRSYLNGEDIRPALQDHKVVSNLEKMMEEQKEMIQDLSTKLEQSITLQVAMAAQVAELKEDKLKLERIVENRNQDLINTIIEEKRKDREERQEKKSFFQRLLGN